MSSVFTHLKGFFKPHLPAVVIFILATLLFVPYPFSHNYDVAQGDAISFDAGHTKLSEGGRNGGAVLWNPYMFSGMPTTADYGWLSARSIGESLVHTVIEWFHIKEVVVFFFLACLGFYLFCRSMKLGYAIATIGGLAYAFGTYNPIIIIAGHFGKFIAIATFPAVAAGVVFILEGLLLEGALLILVLSFGLMKHQQIAYYGFLILGFVAVFYVQDFLRKRLVKPLLVRGGIAVVCLFLALSSLIPQNLMLLDYNKQTVRGAGELNLAEHTPAVNEGNKGLDIDYAFMWSYEKPETFTLLFPGVYGYGIKGLKIDEGSAITNTLQERFRMPVESAVEVGKSFAPAAYFGDSPHVEGPVYFGVLVCLLALIGVVFAFRQNKHIPWLVALAMVSMMMSWGSHLMWFNEFLFRHLPFYKNLRVPAMILCVTEFAVVALAVVGLDYLIRHQELFFKKINPKPTRTLLLVVGGVLLSGLLLYVSLDFTDMSSSDAAAVHQISSEQKNISPQDFLTFVHARPGSNLKSKDVNFFATILGMVKGDVDAANAIFRSFIEDRKGGFGSNIFYAFWLIVLFLIAFYLFHKRTLKPMYFTVIAGLLIYGDLFYVGRSYMNAGMYHEKDSEQAAAYVPTPSSADQIILQDKDPNYRVFNTTVDAFNENTTSAFHKSIGGYNPAKLALYNDLIQHQIGKMNPLVLNMLNTRYIIYGDRGTNNPSVQKNEAANGNSWLVSQVHVVNTPAEEMKALDTLDNKHTVVMQKSIAEKLPIRQAVVSTGDYIREVYFSFDTLRYTYEARSPQLAVFSEIYSPYWKAFDEKGKELPILKGDYALRCVYLPAGKQTIEFRCAPEAYVRLAGWKSTLKGLEITGFLLLVAGWLWSYYRRYKQPTTTVKTN